MRAASLLLLLLGCISLFVAPLDAARVQKEGVHSLKQDGVHSLKQDEIKPAKQGRTGTDRPLIGIMSQPCHDCPGKSYIAAAFVKWVEAAGGRPVPIRFYNSEAELYRLFKQLNGLVFPGGLTWLWLDSPYVLAARKLFNWAVQANDAGDPFPIYGTCLGFQLLHILPSNVSRNDLLVETDSTSHATTLKFWNKQAAEDSLLFGDMTEKLRHALESEEHNIVLQNHMYGLPPPMYEKYPLLSEWYNILSTSKDRNGIEYISTIEGKKYPFFGTQWHPEKPPFEFGLNSVPHSLEAIKVSQSLGSSFIETAKKSSHKPESKEQELELLIYDVCPVFSARFEVMDEENYDGPDMTFYLDHKDSPPVGPDDEGLQARYKSKHPEGLYLG